ncbi:hypothetical protein ABPG77_000684 [Micractinium sp. CCAP 211/92]
MQQVFAVGPPPSPEPSSPNVTYFIQYNTSGTEPLPCGVFNTSSGRWEEQPLGQRYDASGTAVFPSAAVQQLAGRLCSQPIAFGSQLAALVDAQDLRTQDWVQALLSAQCPVAATQALQRAFEVHRLSPGGLSAVLNFTSLLIAAADARGKPACASVVDIPPAAAPTQYDIHTGSPSPIPRPPPPSPGAGQLYAALNLNETRAACPGFNATLLAFNNSDLTYDASGSAPSPDPRFSQQLAAQLCADPSAAATRLVEAILTGAARAQAAAAAVKQALQAGVCSLRPALLAALDLVNPGLAPSNLDQTRTFLIAFAQAADAVGLPECGAYATVDTEAARTMSQHVYHTGSST